MRKWRGTGYYRLMEFDHLVINVRDGMDDAAQAFEQLGFIVTPPSLHSLGSLNRTIVFDTSYIELLGYPPGCPPAARPELVQRPTGPLALVFRTSDADATHRDLTAAGFKPRPVQTFSRPVRDDAGVDIAAVFRVTRLEPDALPGAWVYFCQHLTPELIWRPQWRAHANAAVSIMAIDVRVDQVVSAADDYARATRAAGTSSASKLRLAEGCELRFVSSVITGIAGIQIATAMADSLVREACIAGLSVGFLRMAQSHA